MSGLLDIGAPPAASGKKNAYFIKGSWTQAIAHAARKAEEAIAKARDEAKQ